MKVLLSLGVLGIAALVVVAAGAAAAGDAEAIKKDLKALEGTWKVESFENAAGKKDDFVDATLTFKGEDIEFKKGGETKKGSVKINPAGKPKEIDIKPGDEETVQGIYAIDKDTLKICITEDPTAGRPNEFAAKDKNVLVILKRVKE